MSKQTAWNNVFFAALAVLAVCWSGVADAAEIRVGKPIVKNGMTIGALYLQAVKMDMGHGDGHAGHAGGAKEAPPKGTGHAGHHMHHAGAHATSGDMHLEADIRASSDNDWGFPEGSWIPYLTVTWKVAKQGKAWSKSGTFLPMIASDGPHYGDNVNLDGPGKYTLTYRISPPDQQVFPRHFDKETGVSEWWAPFEVSWDFVFIGTGKKGAY